MRFTVTVRVFALYYAAYKLLADASFIKTLRSYTSSKMEITDAGSSLLAIMLFLLATTDAIPLLEGNNKYFTTMCKLRLWLAAALGGASYFEAIPFSGPLLTSYFGLELMAGLMIFSEESGNDEPMSEGEELEEENDDDDDDDEEEEEEAEEEGQEEEQE